MFRTYMETRMCISLSQQLLQGHFNVKEHDFSKSRTATFTRMPSINTPSVSNRIAISKMGLPFNCMYLAIES